MAKILSAAEAAQHITDKQTLMIGGFLSAGTPEKLIRALIAQGTKNLHLICNDPGQEGLAIYDLVRLKRCRKLSSTYVGRNPFVEEYTSDKSMELELVPQGTLAERVRAGGAGLGGILTPTGVGTVAAEGKQTLVVDGKPYLLELPFHADVAFIKAKTADTQGNLLFHGTARNQNPGMGTAATVVIAEVEEILPVGGIDPDAVHLPGLFVDFLVLN